MRTYQNIDFDEMQKYGNNCSSVKCVRCIHADMLQAERSSCYVRCGCQIGKNKGTWSLWHYGSPGQPNECPDFYEVTDERRKRQVNIAWLISCDRKMEWLGARTFGNPPPNSRPVLIGDDCFASRRPFPEVSAW